MDEYSIMQYITDTFGGVETSAAQGYTFFVYGPDRMMPFATIATTDNEFDRASDLDRQSVYRLNVGISRSTYQGLFGPQPSAPGDAGTAAVRIRKDGRVMTKIM